MNSPARHDRRQTQMGREAACLSELSKEEGEDAFAQEQRWSHRGFLEEGPHTIPKEWSRGTLKANTWKTNIRFRARSCRRRGSLSYHTYE